MEAHLKFLQESHGWLAYLEYKGTSIDKPYIKKGKHTIHFQLFFPEDKIDEFKDRYIGFMYNDRSFSDVKLAEIEDRIIKSSKGYTFVRDKMSELHVCCRHWVSDSRFETRNFNESPKV